MECNLRIYFRRSWGNVISIALRSAIDIPTKLCAGDFPLRLAKLGDTELGIFIFVCMYVYMS